MTAKIQQTYQTAENVANCISDWNTHVKKSKPCCSLHNKIKSNQKYSLIDHVAVTWSGLREERLAQSYLGSGAGQKHVKVETDSYKLTTLQWSRVTGTLMNHETPPMLYDHKMLQQDKYRSHLNSFMLPLIESNY